MEGGSGLICLPLAPFCNTMYVHIAHAPTHTLHTTRNIHKPLTHVYTRPPARPPIARANKLADIRYPLNHPTPPSFSFSRLHVSRYHIPINSLSLNAFPTFGMSWLLSNINLQPQQISPGLSLTRNVHDLKYSCSDFGIII